jgi:hypothetical protein
MSNITKQISSDIAEALSKFKKEEYNKARLRTQIVFTEMVLQELPPTVKDTFAKFPGYFAARKSRQLHGNGCSYQYIDTTTVLPCSNSTFSPTPEQAKVLLSHLAKEQTAKKAWEDLHREIENTLSSLKTYKRISDYFPEAIPYLPEKTSTALSLNIDSLRQKLKK